ncbi:MAG: NAD(P)H-hydrate dehydratase [Christensenellales bacterium]|jgi:hydroxyethylthiazole kinase-like uncharacterized protein yjeF
MRAVTPAQIRQMDMRAIESGIPSVQLMENAARAVARVATELKPEGRIAVLCGRGNNGGDGLGAARYLSAAGHEVRVAVIAEDIHMLSEDSQQMCRKLFEMEVPVIFVDQQVRLQEFISRAISADLVIDALLGTGLSEAPRGMVKEAIIWINSQPADVLSVDIASGVDGETGNIPGEAVLADTTVCLQHLKTGQLLYPGRAWQGQVRVADIGIGAQFIPGDAAEVLYAQDVQRILPHRPANGHKGTFGHVVLFCGSRGMVGAGELAAKATLRAGAGMATLACGQSIADICMQKLTEVMVHPLPDDNIGCLNRNAVPYLETLLSDKSAVAVGPGWGKGLELQAVLQALLSQVKVPMVIDADGLNALSKLPDYRRRLPPNVVMTPHPGEMARINGVPVDEIVKNPVFYAKDLARRNGAVILLKGACTVIAAPDGRVAFNATGNVGMGTAGSGDVLTGIIAALLAQGVAPYDAACVGAFIHGRSGDIAVTKTGITGMIASDLIAHLTDVWLELKR